MTIYLSNKENFYRIISRSYKREIKYPKTILSYIGDSYDLVNFVIDLETFFVINIPDEDSQRWHTVGDAFEYVNNILELEG
jgi:acyl carrier protein